MEIVGFDPSGSGENHSYLSIFLRFHSYLPLAVEGHNSGRSCARIVLKVLAHCRGLEPLHARRALAESTSHPRIDAAFYVERDAKALNALPPARGPGDAARARGRSRGARGGALPRLFAVPVPRADRSRRAGAACLYVLNAETAPARVLPEHGSGSLSELRGGAGRAQAGQRNGPRRRTWRAARGARSEANYTR